MKHLDLFSGAGLFHVAAKEVWPDIELACFVEKEPFAQLWLRANFPGCKIVSDIREFHYEKEEKGSRRGADVYLLSGGFP